jgi:hypothetical protein
MRVDNSGMNIPLPPFINADTIKIDSSYAIIFKADERGAGDIDVSLFKVLLNRKQDEGLDIDESGSGSVKVKLQHVIVMDTVDEGIKIELLCHYL